jgi:hypothetical protein
MCAHLAGMPIEPCFRVQKIDHRSFRGSLSGLGFAYCDFRQHNPRTQLTRNMRASEPVDVRAPEPVRTAPVTPVHVTPVHVAPLANLRPAIEE